MDLKFVLPDDIAINMSAMQFISISCSEIP